MIVTPAERPQISRLDGAPPRAAGRILDALRALAQTRSEARSDEQRKGTTINHPGERPTEDER